MDENKNRYDYYVRGKELAEIKFKKIIIHHPNNPHKVLFEANMSFDFKDENTILRHITISFEVKRGVKTGETDEKTYNKKSNCERNKENFRDKKERRENCQRDY
jgi:hypothetical protein